MLKMTDTGFEIRSHDDTPDAYAFRYVYNSRTNRGEMQDGYGCFIEVCPVPPAQMKKFMRAEGFEISFDQTVEDAKGVWLPSPPRGHVGRFHADEVFVSCMTEKRFLKFMIASEMQRRPLILEEKIDGSDAIEGSVFNMLIQPKSESWIVDLTPDESSSTLCFLWRPKENGRTQVFFLDGSVVPAAIKRVYKERLKSYVEHGKRVTTADEFCSAVDGMRRRS